MVSIATQVTRLERGSSEREKRLNLVPCLVSKSSTQGFDSPLFHLAVLIQPKGDNHANDDAFRKQGQNIQFDIMDLGKIREKD